MYPCSNINITRHLKALRNIYARVVVRILYSQLPRHMTATFRCTDCLTHIDGPKFISHEQFQFFFNNRTKTAIKKFLLEELRWKLSSWKAARILFYIFLVSLCKVHSNTFIWNLSECILHLCKNPAQHSARNSNRNMWKMLLRILGSFQSCLGNPATNSVRMLPKFFGETLTIGSSM